MSKIRKEGHGGKYKTISDSTSEDPVYLKGLDPALAVQQRWVVTSIVTGFSWITVLQILICYHKNVNRML